MRRRGRLLGDAHAIVTGGSSGIGLGVARLLGQRGARVSLVARRRDLLDQAAEQLHAEGTAVLTASADVSDRGAILEAIAALTAAAGPCDVLVTCAGIVRPGYFCDLADDAFIDTMSIDYFGTLWPIRAVAPSMKARRTGSIVGVCSAAGLVGVFGYSTYAPAKYAVRGLLEVIRAELTPYGVHVGCACPPDTQTPMLADEIPQRPAETSAIAGTIKAIPPERVAASIVRGIERRQFMITADRQTQLLAATVGAFQPVYFKWFDHLARRSFAPR